MSSGDLHIPDTELLMVVDGELSARRAAQVRTHLTACWHCRARMAEIEGAIVDFARAHQEIPGKELPQAGGPRALLSVYLAELASKSGDRSWRWLRSFPWAMRPIAVCVALLCAALIG
jgi:anti-sigma factor RsiW